MKMSMSCLDVDAEYEMQGNCSQKGRSLKKWEFDEQWWKRVCIFLFLLKKPRNCNIFSFWIVFEFFMMLLSITDGF